jgi:hypothetical protein
MTAPSPVIVEDDDSIFDAANFVLNVPSFEGRKATKLTMQFTAAASLDRTSEDDLALLEAAAGESQCDLSSWPKQLEKDSG